MPTIRPAAIAGIFYPANSTELQSLISSFLVPADDSATAKPVKALIVPHAGYLYSGHTAGKGYQRIEPIARQIRRVILLGPPHREAITGIALPHWSHFTTPLGTIRLDQAAMTEVEQLSFVGRSDSAHQMEHCLEVQLPFLQYLLDDFTLVPMLVGECSAEQVAQVMDLLWGEEETLIICSSDLSHFHPYQQARNIDLASCELILAQQPVLTGQQACGCRAINGLLVAAKQRHLQVEKLDYCNSGDTAGDQDRVVGYGAFSLS